MTYLEIDSPLHGEHDGVNYKNALANYSHIITVQNVLLLPL